MLTIPQAVDTHADAAAHKVALTRSPGLFLVRAALAGAYIGIGVVVMVTAGGPLVAAGSPWAPLVNGTVFGTALVLVLVAGGELATSAMMILTQGVVRGRVGVGRAALTLVACLVGNLVGAATLAALVHASGVLAPGTAGGDAIAHMVEHKAAATTAQLVVRGVLCNLLVCLAVWCWARLSSEPARVVVAVACVMVFVAAGFEHVVANMTTFSLGLLADVPGATVGEFARNVASVGLGNTLGGALLVGAAYAYGAGPGQDAGAAPAAHVPSAPTPRAGAPGALRAPVPAPSVPAPPAPTPPAPTPPAARPAAKRVRATAG